MNMAVVCAVLLVFWAVYLVIDNLRLRARCQRLSAEKANAVDWYLTVSRAHEQAETKLRETEAARDRLAASLKECRARLVELLDEHGASMRYLTEHNGKHIASLKAQLEACYAFTKARNEIGLSVMIRSYDRYLNAEHREVKAVADYVTGVVMGQSGTKKRSHKRKE